jgi:hypothetical protein
MVVRVGSDTRVAYIGAAWSMDCERGFARGLTCYETSAADRRLLAIFATATVGQWELFLGHNLR